MIEVSTFGKLLVGGSQPCDQKKNNSPETSSRDFKASESSGLTGFNSLQRARRPSRGSISISRVPSPGLVRRPCEIKKRLTNLMPGEMHELMSDYGSPRLKRPFSRLVTFQGFREDPLLLLPLWEEFPGEFKSVLWPRGRRTPGVAQKGALWTPGNAVCQIRKYALVCLCKTGGTRLGLSLCMGRLS